MKNEKSKASCLNGCLYHTVNSFSRVLSKHAEEQFARTGLSPSLAFTLMIVNNNPGISPKELAVELEMAPSTVTRFLDFLELKGFIQRTAEGKVIHVFPTEKGRGLQSTILECWRDLYGVFIDRMGKKKSVELISLLHEAEQLMK